MADARIRGIVHVIEDTKTFGQKGFRKRTVVLEQKSGRFPNYIPLEFTNDGCDSVDELNVGDDVEISYRLGGRKWQKDAASEVKYFLSAEATNFKVMSGNGNMSVGGDDYDSDESPPDDGDAPF